MHSVEKIGGTSMSRTAELLETVLLRRDPYGRIICVSAYAGMTDALLEHRKTGAPGIYASFAAQGDWQAALDGVLEQMLAVNAGIFANPAEADAFARERIEGARSCLLDLSRLCSFGHFQMDQHLMTVRELLASLGEAHSAFNTALLLRGHGVAARFVDLTGWCRSGDAPLDEVIADAFAGIDLTRELPIATGYARCRESLMRKYDRGYSEITLARIAVVTGAAEAVIHKEFHLSSADPRVVDGVRTIGETNYDVADQLSNLGMEAIHPGAAKSLRRAGIPLRVRNAFEPDHAGTVIREGLQPATPGVEIVTGLRDVFALEFHDPDMLGVKGYDAGILDALKRHGVWIVAKTSNANTITHFVKGSMSAIRQVEDDLSAAWPEADISLEKVALVSAIGRDLGDGVLPRALEALAEAGVAPRGIHDLMRKVDLQVVVDPDQHDAALRAMHRGLVERAPRPSLHAAA
ncbi:aspartate kinase [Cereibacter sp. SYSU M97828]|nr:aspartate kinase [Cereibacter flavus]